LNLSLVRDDLDDTAVAVLERQFPGLSVRVAATAQPGTEGQPDGVQPARERGATCAGTGCSGCTRTFRGTIPGTRRPARKAPPAAAAGDGEPAGEFFAALDRDWQLTADQRARLAPAVTAALNAGWTPQALAGFTGANTGGVRNPYAVLAARLAPAELPPPYLRRPSRPPWCGECDQATRMLGYHGDAPRPCPRCKPSAATSYAANGENGRLVMLLLCRHGGFERSAISALRGATGYPKPGAHF
jgi:hypothetical protein